jgi:hypothetical protein
VSAVTAPLRRSRPASSPAVDRHLKVVDEPVKRHTLAFALATMLVMAGAVFGAVTLNALAASTAVAARELDARVAEAERTYAQLVADVAGLEDPARIRESALELGMIPAGAGRQIVLDRNLPADGATTPIEVLHGTGDPLKPVLSVER